MEVIKASMGRRGPIASELATRRRGIKWDGSAGQRHVMVRLVITGEVAFI